MSRPSRRFVATTSPIRALDRYDAGPERVDLVAVLIDTGHVMAEIGKTIGGRLAESSGRLLLAITRNMPIISWAPRTMLDFAA